MDRAVGCVVIFYYYIILLLLFFFLLKLYYFFFIIIYLFYYYYYHRVVLFFLFFFVLLLLSSIFNFRKKRLVWGGCGHTHSPPLLHFRFPEPSLGWPAPREMYFARLRGWLWCFPLLVSTSWLSPTMVFRRKFGSFIFFRSIVVATLLIEAYSTEGHAFLLATEEINNSTRILPNTILKIALGDSRRSGNVAVEETARLTSLSRREAEISIAIIGPASSGPTQLVHRLCNGYKLPQIGYSTTSPSLSDQKTYKYFARLPPSDAFQVVVLANIIRNVVGSNKFIVITGPDLYSTSGTDALVSLPPQTTLASMQVIKGTT